jgi:hypothetical protein
MSEVEQEDGDPAAAFAALRDAVEGLRAEVRVTRQEVEALPEAWAENRPPDYAPNFGWQKKALTLVLKHLQAIEKHPALEMTPEQHAARIENAGLSATREAERAYQKASIEASGTKRELVGMIGQMRGKKEQRDEVLLWAGIAGLGMLLLGLVASPFLASHLPFGWDGSVASIIMEQPDDWNAGAALMKEGNPQASDQLGVAWRLLIGDQANAKAVADCQDQATKTHKAQECRITVPATGQGD